MVMTSRYHCRHAVPCDTMRSPCVSCSSTISLGGQAHGRCIARHPYNSRRDPRTHTPPTERSRPYQPVTLRTTRTHIPTQQPIKQPQHLSTSAAATHRDVLFHPSPQGASADAKPATRPATPSTDVTSLRDVTPSANSPIGGSQGQWSLQGLRRTSQSAYVACSEASISTR